MTLRYYKEILGVLFIFSYMSKNSVSRISTGFLVSDISHFVYLLTIVYHTTCMEWDVVYCICEAGWSKEAGWKDVTLFYMSADIRRYSKQYTYIQLLSASFASDLFIRDGFSRRMKQENWQYILCLILHLLIHIIQ